MSLEQEKYKERTGAELWIYLTLDLKENKGDGMVLKFMLDNGEYWERKGE